MIAPNRVPPVGTYCESCAAWLGAGDGYARICVACRSVPDEPPAAQPGLPDGMVHISEAVKPILERLADQQSKVDAMLRGLEQQAVEMSRLANQITLTAARVRMMGRAS